MNTQPRTYIISFRNTDSYRMTFDGSKEDLEKSPRILQLHQELQDYIREHVADCNYIPQLTTPHIEEVEDRDAAKYAGYPLLDAAAIDRIKQTLTLEARNMLDQKNLDRNAPFDDIK